MLLLLQPVLAGVLVATRNVIAQTQRTTELWPNAAGLGVQALSLRAELVVGEKKDPITITLWTKDVVGLNNSSIG